MKVKFCGITNSEDAKQAIELGVDYLGFIVDFPKSPRSISIDKFLELAESIKKDFKDKVKIVAVTVSMSEEKLEKLAESGLVDVIQFHGNEAPEICGKFKNRVEVWKNISITNYKLQITNYKNIVDKFLMDATSIKEKLEGKYNKFEDFDEFKRLRDEGYKLILAGGLNPENIEDYILKLDPEIVDVASGIEEYPGKKSFVKMEKFVLKTKKHS